MQLRGTRTQRRRADPVPARPVRRLRRPPPRTTDHARTRAGPPRLLGMGLRCRLGRGPGRRRRPGRPARPPLVDPMTWLKWAWFATFTFVAIFYGAAALF